MEATTKQRISVEPQNVCIDLPGEAVQCWRSTDKVRVVLRKHRDVIFDLKTNLARSYTVESTGSDFYDAKKKKLVAGKGKQRVLFNDGERLHLWIARDFLGAFLLKLDGRLILKFEPSKLDSKQYDSLPSTKPDPIVISIGEPSGHGAVDRDKFASQAGKKQVFSSARAVQPSAAPVDEECPLVCVVDTPLQDAPAAVLKAIANGGGKSGLADVDPFDVATRNWLLGQLAGTAAYARDNWDWLKASLDGKTHKGFQLVSAKIHYVRGNARFYFSGYSKFNTIFRQGGFGPGHHQIMGIFGGTGSLGSVIKQTSKGVLGSFKGNALVSFVFGSFTSFAEWKEDASKDGLDLFASILSSAIKAVVVALIVAPIVAAILGLIMFASEAAVAVIAVGAITLGVGIVVSYVVDALDKELGKVVSDEGKNESLSEIMARRMKENIRGNWDYLKRKLVWDYEEIVF